MTRNRYSSGQVRKSATREGESESENFAGTGSISAGGLGGAGSVDVLLMLGTICRTSDTTWHFPEATFSARRWEAGWAALRVGPMRDGRLVIARPWGVPVEVTPAWLLIGAYIAFLFAPAVESAEPGLGPWRYAVSIGVALLFSASILLHELGHAVVALRAGLTVRRITLQLLGGATEFERPGEPGKEARIAAAGPLVSLGVAGALWALASVLDPSSLGGAVVRLLAILNLLIGVVNLLPALPLDGGQVVSALVWRSTGRRHSGILIAGWSGRVLAGLVLGGALVLPAVRPRSSVLVDALWAGLIAAFLWVGASHSLRQAAVQQRLPNLDARALTRRAVPVPGDVPLAEALRRAREARAGAVVVVDGDGRATGLVSEAAVREVPERRQPWMPVSDVARRLEPELRLPAELRGEALLNAMREHPAGEYLVVEADDAIYGVLVASDVERLLTGS